MRHSYAVIGGVFFNIYCVFVYGTIERVVFGEAVVNCDVLVEGWQV